MKIFASALVCQPPFAVGKFAHKDQDGRRTHPYPFEVKVTPMCTDDRLNEEEFMIYCTAKAVSINRRELSDALATLGLECDSTLCGCVIGAVKFRRVDATLWRNAHPFLASVSEPGAQYVYEVCYSRLLRKPVRILHKRAHVGIRWATLSSRVCRKIRSVGFHKRRFYNSVLP